jgi:hypothetical protein
MMMTDTGQISITFAVVVAALAYVGYRIYRSWTGKRGAGCRSCSNCPQSPAGEVGTKKPLVRLEVPFQGPKDQ